MTTVTIREANQADVRMYEINLRDRPAPAPAESADVATLMLTHEQAGALAAALKVFQFADLQAVVVTAETRSRK